MDSGFRREKDGGPDELDSPIRKKSCIMLTPTKIYWDMDASLKASNLPSNFLALTFMRQLDKYRLRHSTENDISINLPVSIKKLHNYCREANEVYVEFINPNIAEFVSALNKKETFTFYKKEILLAPAVHDMDTQVGFNDSFFSSTVMGNNPTSNLQEMLAGLSPFEKPAENKDIATIIGTPRAKRTLFVNTNSVGSSVRELELETLTPTNAVDTVVEDVASDTVHTSLVENTTLRELETNYPTDVSTRIQVGNLPKKFHQDHFLDFITDEVIKLLKLEEDSKVVDGADEHNLKTNTITVEFKTVEYAGAACKIEVPYDKNLLTFQHLLEAPVIRNVSTRIKVGNLPKKFYKDHFLDFITDEVIKLLKLEEDSKVVDGADEYNLTTNTITVELKTVEYAGAACLTTERYDGKYLLTFEHLLEAPVTLKVSTRIKVGNLPKKFYKDHFLDFINDEVIKLLELELEEDSKVVDGADEHNLTTNTITVELKTVEYAGAACLITERYDGKYLLTFEHLLEAPEAAQFDKTATAEVSNNDFEGCFKEDALAGDDFKPLRTTLDGPREITAFLSECILLKTSRPFKATAENMKNVCSNLKTNHNIQVSIEECSLRKKRLDEQYRRNPKSSYCKYMAYLRGDTDVCPKFDVPELSMEDDILAVAKARFTKGASMEKCDVHSLIDVWMDMRLEYYACHKDTRFYRKVSAQMAIREKYFSPDQCQYKMNMLASEFKEYVKARKRTGSGRPREWEFFQPLRPILEQMVSVDAELTYSVGAAVAQTANRHVNPAPSSSNSERYGRERRPAQSAREEKMEMWKSMQEDKKQTMEQMKVVALALGQMLKPK